MNATHYLMSPHKKTFLINNEDIYIFCEGLLFIHRIMKFLVVFKADDFLIFQELDTLWQKFHMDTYIYWKIKKWCCHPFHVEKYFVDDWINFSWSSLPWFSVVQVNNYEIIVNFFHISHNLTWYSAIVHKFTRILPVRSYYELTN